MFRETYEILGDGHKPTATGGISVGMNHLMMNTGRVKKDILWAVDFKTDIWACGHSDTTGMLHYAQNHVTLAMVYKEEHVNGKVS